jgi:hypothetical protein
VRNPSKRETGEPQNIHAHGGRCGLERWLVGDSQRHRWGCPIREQRQLLRYLGKQLIGDIAWIALQLLIADKDKRGHSRGEKASLTSASV